ncbi:MAG: polysaccharide biosynthesis/export family protein [Terrimicrobiaceae bacterium]
MNIFLPAKPRQIFRVLLACGFLSASLLAGEDANYRISPDDLIDFRMFQEPDLDSVIRVSGDGKAQFPLVGSVSLGGLSIAEAVNQLQARYRDGYLVNPQVTLTVRSYAKKRFTVLGQVQKPGSYTIEGSEEITLLQAIGMAGGYTRIADPSNITVKRRQNDRETVLKFNAKKMARGDGNTFIVIKPGDVITVSESIF